MPRAFFVFMIGLPAESQVKLDAAIGRAAAHSPAAGSTGVLAKTARGEVADRRVKVNQIEYIVKAKPDGQVIGCPAAAAHTATHASHSAVASDRNSAARRAAAGPRACITGTLCAAESEVLAKPQIDVKELGPLAKVAGDDGVRIVARDVAERIR